MLTWSNLFHLLCILSMIKLFVLIMLLFNDSHYDYDYSGDEDFYYNQPDYVELIDYASETNDTMQVDLEEPTINYSQSS